MKKLHKNESGKLVRSLHRGEEIFNRILENHNGVLEKAKYE